MKKFFMVLALGVSAVTAYAAQETVVQNLVPAAELERTVAAREANADVQGLDLDHHHFVCYARNQYGQMFEGISHNLRIAEEEAYHACERHHHRNVCRSAGCREHF